MTSHPGSNSNGNRTQRRSKGFSLPELIIAVTILGLLSAIGVTFLQGAKKEAYKNTLNQTLRNGAQKLSLSRLEDEPITASNCLQKAGLDNLVDYHLSCSIRTEGSGVFDISARPNTAFGIGGLLSFSASEGHSCWKTCDAQGAGSGAVLSINHLSLDGDCKSLKRRERSYDCNCVTTPIKTCSETCKNIFYYCCAKGGWPCSNKCIKKQCSTTCTSNNQTTCQTCSKVEFIEDS